MDLIYVKWNESCFRGVSEFRERRATMQRHSCEIKAAYCGTVAHYVRGVSLFIRYYVWRTDVDM